MSAKGKLAAPPLAWNWMSAPMLVASARKVMRLKYSFMPISLCAITPPTMKLVAMPIWFALIAVV